MCPRRELRIHCQSGDAELKRNFQGQVLNAEPRKRSGYSFCLDEPSSPRPVTNANSAKPSPERLATGAVAILQEKRLGRVPGKGFSDPARQPSRA